MNFVSNIGSRNRLKQRLRERRGWTFFVVICLFALVGVVFSGMRIHEMKQQYRVRKWLESIGGYVVYENGDPRSTPTGWLPWTDGEPILDRITEVGITSGSPPVNRAMLELLPSLSRMRVAKFELTDLIDEDLVPLAKCRGLEELSVARSSVTGRGLRYLEGMPKLEILNVELCDYTPEALARLIDTLPGIPK